MLCCSVGAGGSVKSTRGFSLMQGPLGSLGSLPDGWPNAHRITYQDVVPVEGYIDAPLRSFTAT